MNIKNCFIAISFHLLANVSVAQTRIEKSYWDNSQLHVMEIRQVLPDGTWDGYRKTYTWDGVQDINMIYKKGKMLKQQFLAKDGKTPVSEVNYDTDEEFDGMQWSKAFFKPGVLSYKFKAQTKHGEIVKAERFDADGKYMDWSNNRLKVILNGRLLTDYTVNPETKLINGFMTEGLIKVKIKNGEMDSVIDADGSCLAYISENNRLITESINKQQVLIKKAYYRPHGYKAEFELKYAAGDFDFLMNGIANYGEYSTNFWNDFIKSAWVHSEEQYVLKDNNWVIKKEIKKEKIDFRKEIFYDTEGVLLEYYEYEKTGNIEKWSKYNKDAVLVDSYDMQEAKKREQEAIQEAYINDIGNRLRGYINQFVTDDIDTTEKISADNDQEFSTWNGNFKKLISDSALPSICIQLLPDQTDCDSLFKNPEKALFYYNEIKDWSMSLSKMNISEDPDFYSLQSYNVYRKNIDINYVMSDESGFGMGKKKRYLYDRSFLEKHLKEKIPLFYYDINLMSLVDEQGNPVFRDYYQAQQLEAEISRKWKSFSGYFTMVNNKLVFLPDDVQEEVKQKKQNSNSGWY